MKTIKEQIMKVIVEYDVKPWEGNADWLLVGEVLNITPSKARGQYRRLRDSIEEDGDTMEGYAAVFAQSLKYEPQSIKYESHNEEKNYAIAGKYEPIELESTIQETVLEQVYNATGLDRNLYEIRIKKLWGSPLNPQVSYDIVRKPLPDNYEEIFEGLSKLDFGFTIPEHKDDGEHSVHVSTYDLHLGKLGWDGTGHHETIEAYKRGIMALVSRLKGFSVKEVVWVLGNDFLHVEGATGMTTRGTPQDTSLSWKREFDLACEVALWTVNALSQIGRVKVIPVSGNHAEAGDFMLSRVVQYAFGEDIDFDDSHTTRKYHSFGVNGFQFTHGNKERKGSSMSLFITEQPEMYVKTKYHTAFKGHTHGVKAHGTRLLTDELVTEDYGYVERTLPSLNARDDDWHEGAGFIGNGNLAIAHVYHAEQGLVAEFPVRV